MIYILCRYFLGHSLAGPLFFFFLLGTMDCTMSRNHGWISDSLRFSYALQKVACWEGISLDVSRIKH